MGLFIPDVARSSEDVAACRELITRLSPTSVIPPLGEPNNVTYVLRDEEDRSRIHGLTHVEWAPEVRCMLIEPDYFYKKAGFTLLHRAMEMNLRSNGTALYYFTVAKSDEKAIGVFKRDGAEIIDGDMVRFLKRL